MRTTAMILVWMFKISIAYYFGLVLGLGSYDPSSSLIYQNWKVWILLYLPLAMGIEALIVTVIEAHEESKPKNKDGKLKRYLVFDCPTYYPAGGIADVKESFDTAEEAIQYCKDNPSSEDQYVWDRIEDEEIWYNKKN